MTRGPTTKAGKEHAIYFHSEDCVAWPADRIEDVLDCNCGQLSGVLDIEAEARVLALYPSSSEYIKRPNVGIIFVKAIGSTVVIEWVESTPEEALQIEQWVANVLHRDGTRTIRNADIMEIPAMAEGNAEPLDVDEQGREICNLSYLCPHHKGKRFTGKEVR